MNKNRFQKILFISSLFLLNAFVFSTKSEDSPKIPLSFEISEDNRNKFKQTTESFNAHVERIGIDKEVGLLQAVQMFVPLTSGKQKDLYKYLNLTLHELKNVNLPDRWVTYLTELLKDLNNMLEKISPDHNAAKLLKLGMQICEGSNSEIIMNRLSVLIRSLPELEEQDYEFKKYDVRWSQIDNYLEMVTGNRSGLLQMLVDLSGQDDAKLKPLLDSVEKVTQSPSFVSFDSEIISNNRNRSSEYVKRYYGSLYSVKDELIKLIHTPNLELIFSKEGEAPSRFSVSKKAFLALIQERFFFLAQNGLTYHIGSLSHEHKTLLENICRIDLCKFEVTPDEDIYKVVPYFGSETGSLRYTCAKQRITYTFNYNRANIMFDGIQRGSIGVCGNLIRGNGLHVLSCIPDLMVFDLDLDGLVKINYLSEATVAESKMRLNSKFEESLISLIELFRGDFANLINGNEAQIKTAKTRISLMLEIPAQNVTFPV